MEFQAYDVALVPVIMGVVELLKMLGLPAKFASVVSVVLGVIGGLVYIAPGDPAKAVLAGIVMGLSASGLYSGIKNIAKDQYSGEA